VGRQKGGGICGATSRGVLNFSKNLNWGLFGPLGKIKNIENLESQCLLYGFWPPPYPSTQFSVEKYQKTKRAQGAFYFSAPAGWFRKSDFGSPKDWVGSVGFAKKRFIFP